MSTKAPPLLVSFMSSWDRMFASAVFAGIVGDAAHQLQGGYHISIMDQPASNYSVTRPDDKAPPGNWPRDQASAGDMSMNTADMTTCTRRLKVAYTNRGSDPRAKYLNAFNGWEGSGNATRYDIAGGAVSTATVDHKSHVHLEFRRRYVNDPEAYRAATSLLSGETVAQYLNTGGVTIPMAKLVSISDSPKGAGALYISDGATRRWLTPAMLNAVAAAGLVAWPATYQTMTGAQADGTYGPDVETLRGVDGKDGKDGKDGTDGQDGQDGQDGIGAGATVTISGTGVVQV